MKSLFSSGESETITGRIDALSPAAQAQWGRMGVAQMLAHCVVGLQMAVGDVTEKRSLMGYLFGGIAKKNVLNEEPFKRNVPTGKTFVIKDARNFEEEKNKLVALVERFARGGPDGVTKAPHSFFGDLAPKEWDTLMWKHLDHHLRQFGA